MQYKIIDTDSHVNEPPHTWQDRLPSQLKEMGPKVVEMEGERQAWNVEGRQYPLLVTGVRESPGNASRVINPGRFEQYQTATYLPKPRILEMAEDGVDASVIYPGMGIELWDVQDSRLRVACMRAYNDWLSEEFCSEVPDRLFGIAILPIDDGVDVAVDELYRSVKKGHKGGLICSYPEKPLHDSYYDPLWAAAQDLHVPLHWHRANGLARNLPRGLDISARNQGERASSGAVRYFATIGPITYMLFAGVFQRFPGLRVVTAETDFGWLPFLNQICDDQWARYPTWFGSPRNEKRPSDYLREHLYCTFIDDQVGCAMIDHTGADNIMWSSDYPHPVTTWPNSKFYIQRNLGSRSSEERAKLLAGNAVRLYRLS